MERQMTTTVTALCQWQFPLWQGGNLKPELLRASVLITSPVGYNFFPSTPTHHHPLQYGAGRVWHTCQLVFPNKLCYHPVNILIKCHYPNVGSNVLKTHFIFIPFPNIKKIRAFNVPCPSHIKMIQGIIKEVPLIDAEGDLPVLAVSAEVPV